MVRIQDTVQPFCDEMKKVGYSIDSVRTASAIVTKLVLSHEENDCTEFNPDVTEKYVSFLENSLKSDAIGKYYAKESIWFIKKYREFLDTGTITAGHFSFPKLPFAEEFTSVIMNYVNDVGKTDQQRKSRAWAPKRYAYWLTSHGIKSFTDASVLELRQFIMDDTPNLKPKTIPNLRSELKRFYSWLYDHGLSENAYEKLFEFRVPMENTIHPAANPDDIAKVLDVVDRSTSIGKRDYAAFLLVTVLGFRGCDIINLKRTDIDWKNGEIRISQHKTGKALSQPLTEDVANALRDYLDNGRPESDMPHVFLRSTPPYKPLSGGNTLGGRYSFYKKKAGVEGEGGLYPLRRAVGKNLVVAGTPVTTVAQVLGHVDMTNTKQYIDLDTPHMKVCALDFSGIRPRRWNA